jgi:hypothetical protein
MVWCEWVVGWCEQFARSVVGGEFLNQLGEYQLAKDLCSLSTHPGKT